MPTKALLLGATGGCGAEALLRLLERGVAVTTIVRSESRLPEAAKGHKLLTVVEAPNGHLALSDAEMMGHVRGCDAVVSCLGHNLTFKGVYGSPRMLCRDTVRQVCEACRQLQPPSPVKLVVVSTEGVDRPDGADPKRGLAERLVLWLLWLLLPPHADNMAVVEYLHREAPSNPHVEFCAPRPSDMGPPRHTPGEEPAAFTLHATLQNGLFNAGSTRKASVGAFMADLVTKASSWQQWRNAYPHILDPAPEKKQA